ncbi:MAG: hypothetical protein OEZ39_04630 [Gammaproteobacteria bacterium]|nr:hypothetical protein [Gammaproteobacteria bacterium]MDH5651145.1 hypothetical protein [Gammaproteobacteria bacterium]
MGLLDELKKEAEAKQSRQQAEKQRRAELEAHSRAVVLPKLAQVYGFLSDLLKTVDVLQPDTRVTYKISGYGPLENLLQGGYELKADSRDNMTHVSLYFECLGKGKFSFTVHDKSNVDRQKDYLSEHRLSFYTREYRDDRHTVTHALFTVEEKVPVTFDFRLTEDLNTIKLTVRNFDGLGRHLYNLEPEDIDDEFLDELARYLLRHTAEFLKLEISEDDRNNIRQRLAMETSSRNRKPLTRKVTDSNVTYLEQKWDTEAPAEPLMVIEEPVSDTQDFSDPEEAGGYELSVDAVDIPTAEPFDISPAADIEPDPVPESEPEPVVTPVQRAEPVSPDFTKFANLPTPIKEPSRQELDKKTYVDRLRQLHNFPDKLFQNASQSLSSLNRSIIKPAKRLELLHAIIEQAYPVIAATFQKYLQQQHSLPENHTRREVLLACVTLIEQMAIAWKHLFKTAVEANNDKQKDDILKYGFHILEMIRLEQRLRALRYQKMPGSAWRDCNTVFFYLYQYADIDTALPLTGTAGLWPQHRTLKGGQAPVCTTQMLYLSIQLFGILDVSTWPLWLLHAPDSYLTLLDDALKILPDKGQKLVPGFLVAAYMQDRHALFERTANTRSPSALIDYAGLFNFLVKEHENLSKMRLAGTVDETRLSKPLRAMAEDDRIPLLEMMLLSLHYRQRKQQRHAAIGNEELRVYFGFESVYRLLSGKAGQPGSEQTKDDFEAELAGKSSLLQDDSQKISPSWEMINFSSGGLLLGTEETDFLSPIEVGQVVAFQSGSDGQTPLVLGYVSRVQRTSYHNVEIAITRIATNLEAAYAVKTEKSKRQGIPAILIEDKGGKWRLLVQNKHGFINGNPVQLVRADNSKVPARFSGNWLVKSRFTVFDLSSPVLK